MALVGADEAHAIDGFERESLFVTLGHDSFNVFHGGPLRFESMVV